MTVKSIFQSINLKEWRFVLVVSSFVVILTTAVYLYGYLISDDYFLWSNYTNAGDVTVYWSLMEQVTQGEFLPKNLYTNELTHTLMVQPFWLSLGLLAKITHWPKVFIYQLCRIIFGFGLLAFLYLFLSYFIKEIWQRKICFLVLAFGSGIGALINPLYFNFSSHLSGLEIIQRMSPDLFLPESNVFVTIFHSPLLPFSLLVELLILYLFFRTDFRSNFLVNFGLLILVIFLGLFHPYDLMVVTVIPSFFILVLWLIKVLCGKAVTDLKPYLVKLAMIFLAGAIILSYYIFLFKFDPFFSIWSQTNFTESPPPLNLLTGYGLILFFALVGLYTWPDKKNQQYTFLVTWLIANIFLAYLPFSQQRRVLNTVFIPLAVFASLGIIKSLELIFKKIGPKIFQGLIIIILFLVLAASNISVLASNAMFYQEHNQSFYLKKEFYQAALWLKAKKPQVVLASPFISNVLPAITGSQVYIGHLHQTINYDKKLEAIKWFFQNNQADAEKLSWLKNNKIDFIFYSELEKSFGNFGPAGKFYLRMVYNNSQVEIYQVL